ncbi:MAG: hypothetical protein ACO3AD_18220, partial [Burkholderiaceae bacterium]
MDEDLNFQVLPPSTTALVPAAGVMSPSPSSYSVYEDVGAENQPPVYSDATRAYFDKLNEYIGGLGAAPYGTYSWAMPQQSYTAARPMYGKGETNYSVFEDVDTGAPRTTYTTEEQYAPYVSKPVEENVLYSFNVPSNKNTSTGNVSVGYNTPVLLVDNRTGQVVSGGVGFDAARQISEAARQLSTSQGNKASWSIYTGPAGSTDPTQFKSVATETPNKSFLSTVLSIAAPVLGGVLAGPLGLAGALGVSAPAAAAIGSALGSGILGTARGESLGSILKGAALSAAGSFAGGALGKAVGAGGSTAANTAAQAGTQAGTQAAGGALDEIIVNGLLNTGARTAGSALGSTLGGLSAGSGSVPYKVDTANLSNGSVPYSPGSVAAAGSLDEFLNPIVVNALKNTGAAAVGGAAGAGAGSIVNNAIDLGDGTSFDMDTNQIVVTGTKIPASQVVGAGAGAGATGAVNTGTPPAEPLDTDAIEVKGKTQAELDAEKAA